MSNENSMTDLNMIFKKYVVFAGTHANPKGGLGDFKGTFDTQDEAQAHILTLVAGEGCEWFNVLDIQTGEHGLREGKS